MMSTVVQFLLAVSALCGNNDQLPTARNEALKCQQYFVKCADGVSDRLPKCVMDRK